MPSHILSVDQFDKAFLDAIFRDANRLDPRMAYYRLSGQIATNLFYEPSSRTAGSFYTAMTRLGGSVLPITNVQYSSVSKGENLQDTIRTFSTYCDVIVLRHPEVGAAEAAAEVSPVPIINAGDGIGEHPTQALLDLYTILREQGRIDRLVITMVGDLKHGRTVHSLTKLLQRHYDVLINFVSPPDLRMPFGYGGDNCHVTSNLADVIETSDVVYMTRVQKERFAPQAEYTYGITPELMARAKPTMTLMHPLPRNEEIPAEIDADPRAAYFRQMENGLKVRMALLSWVLGVNRGDLL